MVLLFAISPRLLWRRVSPQLNRSLEPEALRHCGLDTCHDGVVSQLFQVGTPWPGVGRERARQWLLIPDVSVKYTYG